MLDRMGLSVKNRWFDEDGRVYIVFTVDEIMQMLNCKSQKATKLIKELDGEEGIGLIERKRLGLGKPNVIYVKNFLIREIAEAIDSIDPSQNFENQKSGILKIENQEVRKSKTQNFENRKSGSSKIENQEVRKSKKQNFDFQKSGVLKIKNQEFRKSKSNNTDINDTESNDTNLSNLSLIPENENTSMDMIDTYRNIVKENISYDALVQDGLYKQEELDELLELVVEVFMLPDSFSIRVGGAERTAAVVKSRYMKLTMMHITYVLECMKNTTAKIGNIKAYLLTALYNATMTMEYYYQSEVGYDLYKMANKD